MNTTSTIQEYRAELARRHAARMLAIHADHAAWLQDRLRQDLASYLASAARWGDRNAPFPLIYKTLMRKNLASYDQQVALAAKYQREAGP